MAVFSYVSTLACMLSGPVALERLVLFRSFNTWFGYGDAIHGGMWTRA